MKIKNFEAFAKRVARKLDTTIVRVSSDAIWFGNYYYINFDGEFIYIADYSKDTSRKVMCAFIYTYNTQKDFFHDLDMMIAIKEAAESEETEEVEEETTTHDTIETLPPHIYNDTDRCETNETAGEEETLQDEAEKIPEVAKKIDNQEYNSMCYNCKKFLNGCRGEKNKIYSGCVYKEKMEVRNNG